VRESSNATDDDGNLDNRFSGTASGSALAQKAKPCGLQTFMQRIVGGEICEIDEFPWAAMLLYESSANRFSLQFGMQINFFVAFQNPTIQQRTHVEAFW
jgi:hypothetical protein